MSLNHVLVTGSNGFLGREIVSRLLISGISVRATDLGAFNCSPDITYRQADITKLEDLKSLFENATTVIHAAGLAHIFSLDDYAAEKFQQINEIGTFNVASAASAAGVKHFILISSVSVYGPYHQGMCDENVACNPVGSYAKSKYNAELQAIKISRESGMALTILRLATLYGEGDPGNVGRLMRTLDRGRFLWIGDGSNRKSLLFKGDAARACMAVAERSASSINLYNVSAPACTMREIVESIADALGKQLISVRIPASLALFISRYLSMIPYYRIADIHQTVRKWLAEDSYDARRFEKDYGFRTETSFADGLKPDVDKYRKRVSYLAAKGINAGHNCLQKNINVFQGATVLVTGATGAVGPCVVHELCEAGYLVRLFSLDTLESAMLPQNIEVLIGDVTDQVAVKSAMQGVHAVVHMAALLHIVNPSDDMLEKYERVNVGGTVTVVDAAIEAGVKRIVLFSTISVYGVSDGEVLNEMSPTNPTTYYAQTKLAAEQIVLNARSTSGQPLGTVLRLGAIYGSRIKGNYERLTHALVRHRFIPIGNGQNRRTLIYDKDVGRVAVVAVYHDAAAGAIFNVTDGGFHTLNEIIKSICSAIGRKPPWFSLPVGPVRIMTGLIEKGVKALGLQIQITLETVDKYTEDIAVDGSFIQKELGFVPQYDLKAGWEDTIREMWEK